MVNNPNWFQNFPSPFNSIYPDWDSLPSKTNAEIKAILRKVNIGEWPQGEYPGYYDLEAWSPTAYKRPTPIGGWKIIPHDRLLWFDQNISTIGGGLFQTSNIGPCVTHAWMYIFFVRYWVPQSAVFQIGCYGKIHHQFNIILSANNDKTINVCHRDLLWNEPLKVIKDLQTEEKFIGSPIFHMYMP